MKTIRKHTQNVWIDTISLACMIVLTITGFLLKYKFPPGSRRAELWGFTRHEWGDFHYWIAIVLIVCIGYHLVLHLPWIKGVISPTKGERKYVKVAAFSMLFIALVAFGMTIFTGAVTHH